MKRVLSPAYRPRRVGKAQAKPTTCFSEWIVEMRGHGASRLCPPYILCESYSPIALINATSADFS